MGFGLEAIGKIADSLIPDTFSIGSNSQGTSFSVFHERRVRFS